MKTRANEQYYLLWTQNPCFWNDNLKDLKRKGIVTKVNGRYYTTVIAHFSGKYAIVDCTCDTETGDFNPICTSYLKEI